MDKFDLKNYITEGKITNQLNENSGMKFFVFDSDGENDRNNEYGEFLVDITNLSDNDIIKKLKTFFFERFVENNIDNEELRDQIEGNINKGSDELIKVFLNTGQIYTDDSELDEKFDPSDLPYAEIDFTFHNWGGR